MQKKQFMQLIDQTPTQKQCFKNRSFIVIFCPKILFRPQIVVNSHHNTETNPIHGSKTAI